MKKIFCIPLLAVPSLLFSQALTSPALDKIKKATVFIEVKHHFILNGSDASSSGSGFFVSEQGWIVTNYHVIQSSFTEYGLSYPTRINQLKVFVNSGTPGYKTYSASVVAVDKDKDLAILAIPDSAEKFPFIEIDTSRLSELKPVWIFGYPFGDQFTVMQRGPEITVNNGSVSALRHDDRSELTTIQIDAVINHGNSGGPVVNESGKVSGIINSMMGSTRINFAVPAHYLARLLKKVPADFSATETTLARLHTVPEDAEVFVDWEAPLAPKKADKQFYRRNGLHTLAVMKKGYVPYIEKVLFTGEYTDSITLYPEQTVVVPAGKGAEKPDSSQAVVTEEEVLMKEDFDDPKRFNSWEQSTGGEKTRTWYLEEGKLNQFENNSVLHAIYLGENSWSNYSVKARVKITNEGGGEKADSRAGIIFRETENGFYLLRIHQETNKAQLAYHCKSPFGWFIIMEKVLDEDIETGKWYALSASVSGNRISCSLNHKPLFTVRADYSSGGRVGFYSVDSKPMFDSLSVVKSTMQPSGPAGEKASLVSFWFSDNFEAESDWWYPYRPVNSSEELHPLYVSDPSFAVTEETDYPQVMEFTKYELQDFVMSAVVSLDEGKDNARFETFIRKQDNTAVLIRIDKKEKTAALILRTDGKEKVLKEKKLPLPLFGSSLSVNIRAEGDRITAGSGYTDWFSCDNKNIPLSSGRIGFSSTGVRMVYHQLTLSSVPKEDPAKGKK